MQVASYLSYINSIDGKVGMKVPRASQSLIAAFLAATVKLLTMHGISVKNGGVT